MSDAINSIGSFSGAVSPYDSLYSTLLNGTGTAAQDMGSAGNTAGALDDDSVVISREAYEDLLRKADGSDEGTGSSKEGAGSDGALGGLGDIVKTAAPIAMMLL